MEHLTAAAIFERGRVALGEKRRKYARQLFRNALKACGPDDGQPLRAAIHVEIGRVARDLGDIGIGGESPLLPCHTTRHAGPHRAVREVEVYPVLLV